MYDPMTVAFEIRYPWRAHRRPRTDWEKRYRASFITIWHKDPETNGYDDDSCGFCTVRLTKEDQAWAEAIAKQEFDHWFEAQYGDHNLLRADSAAVLAAVWACCRQRVRGTHRADRLSAWDLSHVFGLLSSPSDNCGILIRRARAKRDDFEELIATTLRVYRTERRRLYWWKHPRWHVHHWRIQIHPISKFNRWAFSRCAGCGMRFCWGYSPIAGNWDNGGPKFLHGERGVYHHECYPKTAYKQPEAGGEVTV